MSPFTINNVYDEVVPITIGIHVCFRTRLGGNHAPLEPHQSIEAMLYFINNVNLYIHYFSFSVLYVCSRTIP